MIFLRVLLNMEQQDRFIKQQKLMVLMAIGSFLMLIIVLILGWYVFDYSSAKIQKNNEAVNALLKNINSESKEALSETAQKKEGDASAIDFSKKEQVDYANLTAEEVIKLASRHILLTEGEVTVASITNIEGLRADYPELFIYAKQGDKLIFYNLGIIIYDPVLDKVVDVMRRLPVGTVIPKNVNISGR